MAISFLRDKFMPHLEGELGRGQTLPLNFKTSILYDTLVQWDTAISATYNPQDVDERFRFIMSILTKSKAVKMTLPSGEADRTACLAFSLAYPRLCHALLFSADLLLNPVSPFLRGNGNCTWMQICPLLILPANVMDEQEMSILSPVSFYRRDNVSILKRVYESADTLNGLAVLWGNHLKSLSIYVQHVRVFKYVGSFHDMSLYEVCFLVCLEAASSKGFININTRVPQTSRPISWKVNPQINDSQFAALQTIFPSFFWETGSKNVWCTRLCTSCCTSQSTKALNAWEVGLQSGILYQDFRYRDRIAHYTDCCNELASYSSKHQPKPSS
jgi:hypothetical protein